MMRTLVVFLALLAVLGFLGWSATLFLEQQFAECAQFPADSLYGISPQNKTHEQFTNEFCAADKFGWEQYKTCMGPSLTFLEYVSPKVKQIHEQLEKQKVKTCPNY